MENKFTKIDEEPKLHNLRKIEGGSNGEEILFEVRRGSKSPAFPLFPVSMQTREEINQTKKKSNEIGK